MHIQLDFNPSSNNYVRIYILADRQDLTGPLNGYFIQAGGKADELALYKQTGLDLTQVIYIPNRLIAKNINEIIIHVNRTSDTWTLASRLNSESKMRTEGTAKDPDPILSKPGYLGPVCMYSKTNAKKIHFYKIQNNDCENTPTDPPVVPPAENDTVYIGKEDLVADSDKPLEIDSVRITSAKKILLFFNRPIHISRATILISPKGYTLQAAPTQFKHIIHAQITPDLEKGIRYSLLWHNIYSLDEVLLPYTPFSFLYPEDITPEKPEPPVDPSDPEPPVDPEPPTDPELPEPSAGSPANFGDVIISEIMANPKGLTSLPEVEYIELLNKTKTPLTLKKCTFWYSDKKVEIPDTIIAPGQYVILCHASKSGLFGKSVPTVGVTSFPVLANTGKLIYLENPQGVLLHWIEYSDKWYGSTKAKEGGFSLEMIDSDFLYSSAENWHASTAGDGGTPGKANSIEQKNPDLEPLYLTGHSVTGENEYSLCFSKSVDLISVEQALDQSGYRIKIKPLDYPKNMQISFSAETDNIPEYHPVSLPDVSCIDGIVMLGRGELLFGKSAKMQERSVCVNELMLRPLKDDIPFIELLNISEELLDLSDLYIAMLNADSTVSTLLPITTESVLWEPGCYALLCTDPLNTIRRYDYHGTPQLVRISSFPKLDPETGRMALTDASGKIIESVYLRKTMYQSVQGSLAGISLERKDPEKDALIVGNWTPGHHSTGFATPGYANFADTEITDPLSTERNDSYPVQLLYDKLLLEKGLPESDLTLTYQFETTGYKLNATLYTASGVKVCRLAI
ncbi:MAG: lamin tail domain-containing protein, partial [Bacteroidales bacterium]